MVEYHDVEWGVPQHDDAALFELLTLEGAQAGLSWTTILRKRDGYRDAFAGFVPAVVAAYTERDIDRLTAEPAIVRHCGKIESTVTNARAVVAVQQEFGSFGRYVWEFVGGEPVVSTHRTLAELPSTSDESRTMSKDLKRRGFRFVGPTTVYAFMQAAGLVDDHVVSCFRRANR
jgi:DNA-3-methyladenine glycosylase I